MMQIILQESDIDPELSIAQNVMRVAMCQLKSKKNIARFFHSNEVAIRMIAVRIKKKCNE
jgi:hypothetical protein